MPSFSLPVDLSHHSWRNSKFSGRFNPQGTITFANKQIRANPTLWDSEEPMYSARIFVGFNVGRKTVFSVDDLISLVKPVRKKQVGMPDMSVLYQKGVYTSMIDGKDVTEPGAQLIFLNLPHFNTTPRQFEKQVIEVCDTIVDKMQQETVFANIQKDGINVKTICVASQEVIDRN